MREKERGRGWMDGGHLPHFTSPCWQTQAADLCFWGCLFTFSGFSLFTAAAPFWYPKPALRVKHLAVKSQDWRFRIFLQTARILYSGGFLCVIRNFLIRLLQQYSNLKCVHEGTGTRKVDTPSVTHIY